MTWGPIFCFLVVFGPFVSPRGLVGRPWAAGGRILERPTEGGGRQLGLEQKKVPIQKFLRSSSPLGE